MSNPDLSAGQPKYYDPSEVEAYIKDATTTITALQSRLEEMTRRAADAEEALGDYHPETASLGRALLLASEVADKTIAEADAKAAEIGRSAGARAQEIVEAAEAEAHRVMEAAKGAAAEAFEAAETRLLAAVSAFVEGSNVLRAELSRVEDDATGWRNSIHRSHVPSQPPPAKVFAPPGTESAAARQPDVVPSAGRSDAPDQIPPGTSNGISRKTPPSPLLENKRQVGSDPGSSGLTVTPFLPLQPPVAGYDDRRDGSA